MSDQPNILMIVADQWRFDYLGAAGCDWLRTPNLDALAARGALVSHCCTTSPVCVPARIGLATGQYPERFGSADNHSFLPGRATTFYQRLRDANYYTGVVGKLDLAKPQPYNGITGQRPSLFRWGFTHPVEAEGKMHAGSSATPIGPYTADLDQAGFLHEFHQDYQERQKLGWFPANHDSVVPTEWFEDAWIGRRAAKWIDEIPNDFPWFLGVHFVGPHDPFGPPSEYADRWRDAEVPEPVSSDLSDRAEWIQRRQADLPPERVRVNRRQYAAAIEAIDDAVGQVIAALERSGSMENTYIVFTADHGEMLGDLGLWQKHVPYDPSVRIPLIATGPRIPAGVTREGLVELSDLNPTICEWAGLKEQQDIDARSCADFLNGTTTKHRDDCYIAERRFRSLRTLEHLFIQHSDGRCELHNMKVDPHATTIVDNPGLIAQFSRRLTKRVHAGEWHR